MIVSFFARFGLASLGRLRLLLSSRERERETEMEGGNEGGREGDGGE